MTQQLPSTTAGRDSRISIAADGTVVVAVDFDAEQAPVLAEAARFRARLSGLWAAEQDEDLF